eukprot:549059_1
MSKSSLKDNIIKMQSQLKHQQNILQHIKQNIFDINSNKQNIKQTETYIENRLNEIDYKYENGNNNMEKVKDLYENMSQQIESIRLLYETENNEDNDVKKDDIEINETNNGIEEIVNNNYNEEKEQLVQIQNAVEQLKGCLSEMHNEHIIIMEDEKRKYDKLEKTYKNYQMDVKINMQQLTRDIYDKEYKKYNGYKDMVHEMIGNAGSYTKDAIIHYLHTQ